jgi:alpha-glucosidase
MQWDDSPNAGFTTGDPWLPIAEDHAEINVTVQSEEPGSMLEFFRGLIRLRKKSPALSVGSYTAIETGNDAVFAYLREHEGQRIVVALNFSEQPTRVDLAVANNGGELLCSTHLDRAGALELRPYEGLMILTDSEKA